MMEMMLLTNEEAAKFLKISPRTLTNWRSARNARIPFSKVGRGVRYNQQDLVDFVNSNTKQIS